VSVCSNRTRGAVIAYLEKVTNDKRKIQAAFKLLRWLQRSPLKVQLVANLPLDANVVVKNGSHD
jgi:hypothetical protein